MVSRATLAALACTFFVCGALTAEARSPTAEDVLTLREIGDYRGGLSISPDGTQAAFFERELRLREDDYRYHLLVVPADGGRPRGIAEGGDIILSGTAYGSSGFPINRAPLWSPNSQWLAYLYKHDGRIELWRVRAAGGAPQAVVTEPGDVLRYAWLDDNHLVVETATPRRVLEALATHQEVHGFAVDGALEPYYSLRPIPPLTAQTHQTVIDINTSERRAPSPAEVALLSGPAHAPAPADALSIDRTPAGAAWVAPRTPGDTAETPLLGLYRDDNSPARACADSACAGHLVGAWLFNNTVVFQKLEGQGDGFAALHAWTGERTRLLRSEDDALLGCGRAGTHLLCYQESPASPRRLVSIDIATGTMRTLYDPNPQWAHLNLTRVERIDVHDAYGNDSYAHLVYPAGYVQGRRYPVVIVQYKSRGFLRGGTGGEYPIHPLAARGYFVLSVDRPEWRTLTNHLTPDAEQVRTELDNSENLMKQSAIEAMLAELDRRGLSDTHRIGITGVSNGAESLFWAITRSHLFAAAVASSPPLDTTAWTLGAGAFRASLIQKGGEGPWADPSSPWGQWWQRNTTVLHADAIHTPLMMNLTDSEAMMGFALTTRLSELSRPVDVYIYPGAGHLKSQPQQLLAAQMRAMDWLDFWLRGIETADPDEPDRLARWRALRTELNTQPAR